MTDYKIWKLKDVTVKIGSGATPRGGKESYFTAGVPLIRSLNVYDLHFQDANLAFINEQQANDLSNVIVEKDDVLLNITGASVCRCASVPEYLVPARVNQHVAIIRADRINLDGKYLKYLLVSPKYKRVLLGLASTGATREALTKGDIENFEVEIPEIESQKHISSIISNYDNLIENNEKRIKALEEMAQLLYTEWFIKFHFPEYTNVKMFDSGKEYGEIPQGWRVVSLKEIADLVMGQSPISEHYNQSRTGTPFHQGVADFGYKYPTDRVYSTHGNKYADKGDLLFSVRAPVGQMNIANKRIILGRGLCAIRRKDNRQALLYSMFNQKFTHKDMIGNGAIYKSVNKTEMEGLKFIKGPTDIEHGFEEIASKYFDEMEKITALNLDLLCMRDLLIPQFITGKRALRHLL